MTDHKKNIFKSKIEDLEPLREAIRAGVDVDARNESEYMEAPLHIAAFEGCPQAVEALLAAGADVDIRNSDGCTPLHWACSRDDDDGVIIVKRLLSAGASVGANESYGETPLHYASVDGSSSVIDLLIERGADVHARNDDGEMAIHKAHSPAVLGALLRGGASIDAQTPDLCTPLHHAIKYRKTDVAIALIDRGCDIDARDISGRTALESVSPDAHTRIAVERHIAAKVVMPEILDAFDGVKASPSRKSGPSM